MMSHPLGLLAQSRIYQEAYDRETRRACLHLAGLIGIELAAIALAWWAA